MLLSQYDQTTRYFLYLTVKVEKLAFLKKRKNNWHLALTFDLLSFCSGPCATHLHKMTEKQTK